MTRRRAVLVALAGFAFAGLSAGETADEPRTTAISGTANVEAAGGVGTADDDSVAPSDPENATATGYDPAADSPGESTTGR